MTNPSQTDPAPTDPAGIDPAGTEPAGTEPAGTDPAGTDPAQNGPAPTGPAAAGRTPTGAVPTDPAPWELVGERPGYDGFMSVRVRRYRLPDGREVEWDVDGVSGSNAGVAVLALTPEGRIVAVRMFRAGPDQVVTNLPGGLIDEGEEPAAAAARELEEETGYTCESVEVVGWGWAASSSTYRKYVAIARGCRPDGKQSLDEFEDCVPIELTVDELRTELRTPGRMTGLDSAYLALDHAGLL